MAYRTRKNMEAILASGASVMLPDGRVAITPDQLPTEEKLAQMDAEFAKKLSLTSTDNPTIARLAADLEKAAADREQSARAELQAQIDQLQARLHASHAPESKPAAPAAVPSLSPAQPPPQQTPVNVAKVEPAKAEVKK